MSRHEKQRERLGLLEQDFLSMLRRQLARVADGYETAFFHAERFSSVYPNTYLRQQNRPIEAILSLGDEILKLCEQLDQQPWPTVLALHGACEQANDYSNPHRLGPIRLAQRLLAEIEQIDG